MTLTRKIAVGFGIILLAWLACHWWNWRPNLDDYVESEAVDSLELTLDGVPFPDQIHRDHVYVVNLRFRPLGRFRGMKERDLADKIQDIHFDAYHNQKVDTTGLSRVYARGEGPELTLSVIRDGKPINVTPLPPQKGEDFLQYAGLFQASRFQHYAKSTEPLEYVIWIFPPNAPDLVPGEKYEISERIIFRKQFRLID